MTLGEITDIADFQGRSGKKIQARKIKYLQAIQTIYTLGKRAI